MQRQEIHVSDEELLLLEDGELPLSRSAEIRSHMEACWSCRTRVKEIEDTIVDFVHVHRAELIPTTVDCRAASSTEGATGGCRGWIAEADLVE